MLLFLCRGLDGQDIFLLTVVSLPSPFSTDALWGNMDTPIYIFDRRHNQTWTYIIGCKTARMCFLVYMPQTSCEVHFLWLKVRRELIRFNLGVKK